MIATLRGLFVAIAAGALAAAAAAQPAASQAASDAKAGQAVFMRDGCWQCHGTTGGGSGSGPKIAPEPLPFDAYARQVRTPRSAMPVYTSVILSDRELADIYAYLKSVPAAKPYKDIALLNRDPPIVAPAAQSAQADLAGAAPYAAQCAVCHGADLQGGSGPTLRTLGGRDPATLTAKIRTSMPLQAPGSLSDAEAAALARYILARNGAP